MTRVFIAEPWQVDLLGDEIAWRAGLHRTVPDAVSLPDERRLHAAWRELLAEPGDPTGPVPEPVRAAVAAIGRDAELATARLLVSAGRTSAAEEYVRQIIDQRGADERNLVLLGSLVGNRNTREALVAAEALFARATEIAPDQAEPWVRLGIAQRKLGKVEMARQSWMHALAIDPSRRDAAAFLRNLDRK